MKKYRFQKEGDPYANGSIPVFALWMGGPLLAGIRNCPIEGFDLKPRTAYVSGEPLTWFSVPARVRYRGKRVTGFLMHKNKDGADDGYVFIPNADQRHKLGDCGE